MKNLLIILFVLCVGSALAQVDDNEFILSSEFVDLAAKESDDVVAAIGVASSSRVNPQSFVRSISNALSTSALKTAISSYDTEISKPNEDYALIVVYRKMDRLEIKDKTPKTVVYHSTNKWNGGNLSDYLLETSHVMVLFLDLTDTYYEDPAVTPPSKLASTTITITRNTSFFRQSLKDLVALSGSLGGGKSPTKHLVRASWVVLEPKKLKAPCSISLANEGFSSDLKFEVHERNVASVQVGVVNSKFSVQDFKISGGNLVVSPDTAKQKEWKSNLFAALELHLPRDVDNFKPIWRELFYVNPDQTKGKKFFGWLYRISLNRVGVYGGLKLSKDPLSNLYSGFNYAISKDLCVNFGWTWNNEITPQITNIGSITSISDAKEFAQRKYSKPTFAIGLSFSPSSVITMFGAKDKEEKK